MATQAIGSDAEIGGPASTPGGKTMSAVIWDGQPFNMSVQQIPVPKILKPDDAIVQVTSAAICGSDLHVYHGILGSSQVPWAMGHEAMGFVTEVGSSVTFVKIGDRVVINCIYPQGNLLLQDPRQLNSNDAIFGFGEDFGDLGGCQAELVRVPKADSNLFIVNDAQDIPDDDLLFMSDIFCTGWQNLDFAGFNPGDSVAVFGAGPMGLLCAYSAILRGASQVFSIDHVDSRLEKAKSIGCIPIDLRKGSPADQILKILPGGVARSCDCIGEECVNSELLPQQDFVINQAIQVTAPNGGIGLAGVYLAQPDSAGVPRGTTISPTMNFPISMFWAKALSIRGGSVNTTEMVNACYSLIKSGRAKTGFIVSGKYAIADAAKAYDAFNSHKETKVLFTFPAPNTSLAIQDES